MAKKQEVKPLRGSAMAAVTRRSQRGFLHRMLDPLPLTESQTKAEMRAKLLAQVGAAIDAEMALLNEGEGLGVVFRLQRFYKGNAFVDEPSARECPEARLWRLAVFERDRFACTGCGASGCELHAHHVKGLGGVPGAAVRPGQRGYALRGVPRQGAPGPGRAHPGVARVAGGEACREAGR